MLGPVEVRSSRTPIDEDAPHVLVAEDDPELRDLLSDALVSVGCVVLPVADGGELAECIERFSRGELPVDLVITDLRMPRLNGLAAVDRLRRVDWKVPVVVISAYLGLAEADEALRLGAVAVFSKPFEVRELLDELPNWVATPELNQVP